MGFSSLLCGALLSVLISPAVGAVPKISQYPGGLTILSDNDLLGQATTKTTGAILINGLLPHGNAQTRCEELGESLFSQEEQAFNAGLNNSLSYLLYSKRYPSTQQFWVEQLEGQSSDCTSIYANGTTTRIDCARKLPSLCTHSAPISNSTSSDKAARFQVTQQVGNTEVTGYRDFHSWRFLGVRYAVQGYNRFYHSILSDTQTKATQSALEYGADCVQAPGVGEEDCFFMNIYTPHLPSAANNANVTQAQAKAALKPVMFYVYGGSWLFGSLKDPFIDGTNLASRGDVVVVTINHRLGAFGFFTLLDGILSGNYALGDLVNGLQWVQQNIKAFGGDPDRVTLFGESSGAAAIRALLSSPKAKGLFAGAIMQSSPVGLGFFGEFSKHHSIEEVATTTSRDVLIETDCIRAQYWANCMMYEDKYRLTQLKNGGPRWLTQDQRYLTTPSLILNGSAYAAPVPIMIGLNRDEGGNTVPFPNTESLPTAVHSLLDSPININATSALSSGIFPLPQSQNDSPLYSQNITLNTFGVTSRIVTDAGSRCLSHATAYSASLHNVFPAVYAFEFNRTYNSPSYTRDVCEAPRTAAHPNGDPSQEYFKCHGGENMFVTGTVKYGGMPDRDGRDVLFSRLVVDYWAAFARAGDPNPSEEYLKARGFWSTIDQVDKSGVWERAREGKMVERVLQWNEERKGGMRPFGEADQCKALGLPLDYYEEH